MQNIKIKTCCQQKQHRPASLNALPSVVAGRWAQEKINLKSDKI
jgi:hypothetical protein